MTNCREGVGITAEAFYPFVDDAVAVPDESNATSVRHAARVAVYDDAAAAPRVVVIDPTDVRTYLEEITATVARLSKEQGGSIPFTVIREIVENLIHAYFSEPIISILDDGDTIRFADQGPGIANKELALEYGTTSATDEMKRYIRGVGSGLPYAQQWLEDKGGTLRIEDNISRGTVVTISLVKGEQAVASDGAWTPENVATPDQRSLATWPGTPAAAQQPTYVQQPAYAQPGAYPAQIGYAQQPGYAPAPYAPPAYPQVGYAPQVAPAPSAVAWPMPPAAAPAQVSERGMMALGYLATHESVGPTELVGTFGHSQSTWTRELKALEALGLIEKHGGQKRFLTPAGRAFLAR